MVNIRPAGKDEVKVLQDLNDEVFIDNQKYDADLDMDWAQSDKGKKYFTELLDNTEACCFIAEDNEKKIGYIAAGPKPVSYRKSRDEEDIALWRKFAGEFENIVINEHGRLSQAANEIVGIVESFRQ